MCILYFVKFFMPHFPYSIFVSPNMFWPGTNFLQKRKHAIVAEVVVWTWWVNLPETWRLMLAPISCLGATCLDCSSVGYHGRVTQTTQVCICKPQDPNQRDKEKEHCRWRDWIILSFSAVVTVTCLSELGELCALTHIINRTCWGTQVTNYCTLGMAG